MQEASHRSPVRGLFVSIALALTTLPAFGQLPAWRRPRLSSAGIDSDLVIAGDTLGAFVVREWISGDANGDGDTDDRVLHVRDIRTGATRNLRLALFANSASPYPSPELAVAGNRVVFRVWESGQGVDLNGDGDIDDRVAHVYDAATGAVTNVGLATPDGPTPIAFDGRWWVFRVPEESQAMSDLNGDGDRTDFVAHALDTQTGQTTNLRIPGNPWKVGGGRFLVLASEWQDGGTDFNGDGDGSDEVILVYDTTGGIPVRTGFAGTPGLRNIAFDGDVLAIPILEGSQGGVDLNGDGDVLDHVVHLYNVGTGQTTNTGFSCGEGFQLGGGMGGALSVRNQNVLFLVDEIAQTADVDGDGVANRFVLVLNQQGTTTMLGPTRLTSAVWNYPDLIGERSVVYGLDEASTGTDLNTDGDILDVVVHVRDLVSGSVLNLELACVVPPRVLDGDRIVILVDEDAQGRTDLNGDGDATDGVIFVHDAGATRNLGFQADGTPLTGGDVMVFPVLESTSGIDYNGDGDTADTLPALHHLLLDVTAVLPMAQSPFTSVSPSGKAIGFGRSEVSEGLDLDLDGQVASDVASFVKWFY
jgi:hypothetical protein